MSLFNYSIPYLDVEGARLLHGSKACNIITYLVEKNLIDFDTVDDVDLAELKQDLSLIIAGYPLRK